MFANKYTCLRLTEKLSNLMNSFLESSKFSSRLKKSTTMVSNSKLKHPSFSKKTLSNPTNNKKILSEMTKDLKKKQEKLMSLEQKNLGLVELNRNLIDDLRKSQSNSTMVRKYEREIAYLKESQQELFQESCELKTQIKSLQNKIERYLEDNVEEKNMLREYYNSYFKEQLQNERSKNQQIIRALKKENDDLKHILRENSYHRENSLYKNSAEHLKTSKKSSLQLSNLLSEGRSYVTTQENTEKKPKKIEISHKKQGSFQNFPTQYNENSPKDDKHLYRRMSNQMNRLEDDINRLHEIQESKKKMNFSKTSRHNDENIYFNQDARQKWKYTQDNIYETLQSMKKEIKRLEHGYN